MNFDKGGVFAEKREALPPARFLLLPVPDKQASIKAGHEKFKDKPYIEILKQGGATVQFAVNDEFKNRYPEKWAAFEAGLEEPQVGLPLGKWPGCSRAECENLKSVNLFTVEDLAAASDTGLNAYGMGSRELQKKAKAFLEAAKDNGSVVARLDDLEKKMKNTDKENEKLKSINKDLLARLEASKGETKGRPKKA